MRHLGVAATALALIVVIACGRSAAPASDTAPKSDKAGGSGSSLIRVASPTFGEQSLDPTLTTVATSVGVAGPMWDWLTEVDSNGKLVPALADSWQEAPDGLSWDFKLHKGVKFHNGQEMTANDVQFTLMEAFRRPEATSSRSQQFRDQIAGVDVIDPYTFRIRSSGRWPTLPYDLSAQPGIEGIVLPQQYLKEVGWDAFAKKPIGTGPWKMVRYDSGRTIEFEAVKDHWKRPPKFDRLESVVVPEETTRLAMLRTGEADVASISLESLPDAQSAGLQIISDPDRTAVRVELMGTYLPEAGPTGDVRVRQALNLAINRQEMVNTIFRGRGEPSAVFPVGKISIGYPDDLKPYPFDPERARRLLTEAGLPNGFNFKLFAVQSGSFSQGPQVAEAVAGYWEQVGIRTTIVPIDIGSIRPKYVALAPDVVGAGQTFTSGPRLNGLDDLRVWWTRGAKITQLAELDDIAKRASSATTVDEIANLVKEGYHIVYNDYRSIPIANVDAVVWGLSKKVASIDMIPHRGVIEPSLATASPSR